MIVDILLGGAIAVMFGVAIVVPVALFGLLVWWVLSGLL